LKNAAFVIFDTLLIATFALWFGGFTFYVSFVVPIGTEVLGSARSQGFITQQVTNWLNVACGCAVGLMLLESVFRWGQTRRPWREIRLLLVLAIGCLLIGLILLHPSMDRMLVAEREHITDRAKFYGMHRVYLWGSTFQWVAAWIWLIISVVGWRRLAREGMSPLR
jgi:hypothetical protein